MTKKEALLIAKILNRIAIKANQDTIKIKISRKNIGDTFHNLVILERITRKKLQIAEMSK